MRYDKRVSTDELSSACQGRIVCSLLVHQLDQYSIFRGHSHAHDLSIRHASTPIRCQILTCRAAASPARCPYSYIMSDLIHMQPPNLLKADSPRIPTPNSSLPPRTLSERFAPRCGNGQPCGDKCRNRFGRVVSVE